MTERLHPYRIRQIIQIVTGDSVRPVAVGPFNQGAVPVTGSGTLESQVVRIPAGRPADQPINERRVADLVLRDAGEGQILLQHRREAGPFRVAVAKDQLVIGPGQKVGGQRVMQRRGRPWTRRSSETFLYLSALLGDAGVCLNRAIGLVRARSSSSVSSRG